MVDSDIELYIEQMNEPLPEQERAEEQAEFEADTDQEDL